MTWQPLEPSVPMRDGKRVKQPEGTDQWMNDTYVVQRRVLTPNDPENPPAYHLSIRRQDRAAARDWRDFQRIKNQLCGPDHEGVEVYPAEDRKVDTANQYHLWVFPFRLGFGLSQERMVTNHDVTTAVEPGAVQRDHEEVDGPLNNVEETEAWLARTGGRGQED